MTIKRFDYIDIAKGIGILMVVWAHVLITGWTHRMIYAFHMPLFFLLSGMLFKRNKYNSFKTFAISRAKRLLIPYVIYSVVTWVIWAVFKYLSHDNIESLFKPLLQTLISQGSGEFMVHNSALWFIPCLFLVEILYFFIRKLGKLMSVVISFSLAALSFLLGHIYGADFWMTPPWNADAALIALPFYCVGNIIFETVGHEKISNCVFHNKWYFLFAWIAMTSLLYWSSMTFGECSLGSSSYQCNGLIFMLRAFLGCAWLIILALFLEEYKGVFFVRYLKWAGIKSLDIMCIHIPLKGICMIVLAKLLHSSVEYIRSDLAYSSISFIFTMVVCWITIRFIVENVTKISSKIIKK